MTALSLRAALQHSQNTSTVVDAQTIADDGRAEMNVALLSSTACNDDVRASPTATTTMIATCTTAVTVTQASVTQSSVNQPSVNQATVTQAGAAHDVATPQSVSETAVTEMRPVEMPTTDHWSELRAVANHRAFVSPYLLRQLRSLEHALADIVANRRRQS